MKQPKATDQLNPQTTSPKLRTTIDLSIPYDDEVYQFIYGSQLYGTSFAVFANFNCKIETDEILMLGISLKLINYKGSVNIGFNGGWLIPPDLTDTEAAKEKINLEHLIFYVQGLHSNANIYLDFTERYSAPVKVKKNESIVFNRILSPYNDEPVRASASMEGISQGDHFFDSEFYYRDGYFEAPNERRDGQEGYAFKDIVGDDTMLMPSLRCHQSNAVVVLSK